MPQCARQISRAARLLRVEALFLDSTRRFRQVSRLLLDAWSAVALAEGHGVSLIDRGVGPETPDSSLSVVTCCFTTPRRRQRFYEHEAVVAQLCKLCLSPLVTAQRARRSGPKL